MKEYYAHTDFIKCPKFDAHHHYHSFNDLFVSKAKKANMRLLSINTNFEMMTIDKQFKISHYLHQRHPNTFDFIGTFDASEFASETFVDDAINCIKQNRAAGARGIKIWKNIGMTLKNEIGQYIMADHPVFAPIFTFMEKEKIPVLSHLGEPRNCWLPLDKMSTDSDRRYFSKNPDFHMYLHPEVPSYEQQIKARDHILEHYPELILVGAHLGSMEWSLEEVAKRLDRFPNFYIDISGRFNHILEHALRNRNQTFDFFETYQNRIIYGLDLSKSSRWGKWIDLLDKFFPRVYMYILFKYVYREIQKQWLFFATDQTVKKGYANITGLKLKKSTVDRIFHQNAIDLYCK